MSPETPHTPHAAPPAGQAPVIGPGETFETVTDKISALVLSRRTSRGWLAGFGVSCALLMLLLYAIGYLLAVGIGIWGVNIPVAWGFAIINFDWWIGIGHAGTLISAALLLLHQTWRRSISRFAETMTLFAIACAGLFPLLHLGRPQYFYWLLPYPNTMNVWPQFRSALVWDVFAVLAYMLVSLLFWYVGLIPDLATMRDRARHRTVGRAYAILALGWRGDAAHWRRHQVAYHLLGGLAVAMIVSVHSVVAFNFATTVLPGWHSAILPPYFVAGALHSGFAMVLVLTVPLRRIYGLEEFLTGRHLQNLAKLLLAMSLTLAYSYLVELFFQWYGGKPMEWDIAMMRMFGPYAASYWAMLACNVAVPQLLWSRRLRSRPVVLWMVGLIVLVGMWLERYMIVLSSLQRDFLPSSWGPYTGTLWDWATFLGTFGLFFVLLFAFLRVLPMIPMSEVRELAAEPEESGQDGPREQKLRPAGSPMYGLLAEFERSDQLADAVCRAREAGYKNLEAYSPVPAEDVAEALGRRRMWLPALVLLGGIAGAVAGYFMQYYLNAVDYPLNVGGRPLNSWPAFLVVTFETTALLAALSAVLGMLALNGLPRLYHPVFNVPRFSLASRNRFFLCVRADDIRFLPEAATRGFLAELQPSGVWDVPP